MALLPTELDGCCRCRLRKRCEHRFRSTHTLRFVDGTEKRMVLWNGTNNGVRFIETGDDAVSKVVSKIAADAKNAIQRDSARFSLKQGRWRGGEMAEAERQVQFVRERVAAQRAADKAEGSQQSVLRRGRCSR